MRIIQRPQRSGRKPPRLLIASSVPLWTGSQRLRTWLVSK